MNRAIWVSFLMLIFSFSIVIHSTSTFQPNAGLDQELKNQIEEYSHDQNISIETAIAEFALQEKAGNLQGGIN